MTAATTNTNKIHIVHKTRFKRQQAKEQSKGQNQICLHMNHTKASNGDDDDDDDEGEYRG